ncbi:response regulator transcription factor [Streptomyces sp. SS1-1]|uniref:response regulator transcription factor n=1 Tax=unclassified Streptomyces TaxID=2593676 RepID=UPI0012503022|nr:MULTISPECIES: response regulator transcription factor [unclassified Streptomyces]KAB2971465.1 response regulator transcription factor [Streptomyces sp. SS1-1]MDI9833375.1 response regulator transcription factor [Streptomyces sp. KAU_LT]
MRVLLIEDDDRVAGPLMEGLSRFGFTVDRARTGSEGLAAGPCDMVLLDLGLPDIDGIEVCRALRLRSQVPIIMITARSDEVDRVLGLEIGADDYLSKPFGVRELIARIRAVTRRSQTAYAAGAPAPSGPAGAAAPGAGTPGRPSGGPQRIGPLTIDRRTRQVHLGQEPVSLSPKEYDLLVCLADDPGAVCTRQHILDTVWQPNYFGPTKTLDVHIAALRRKLGDSAWIDTIRGVGFRLQPPDGPTPPAPTTAVPAWQGTGETFR